MTLLKILFILVCIVKATFSKKAVILKPALELLEKEKTHLEGEKIVCMKSNPNKVLLNDLRRTQQDNSKTRACHITFLQSNKEDGWAWTSLGQIYLAEETTASKTKAKTCFKQAHKLTGKTSAYVKDWHVLGPFVIGKAEVDGDPITQYGGIQHVSKSMYTKKQTVFHSELASDGLITWSVHQQQSQSDVVQIQTQIDWNDLVRSLSSTGIMEWQGWAVGEFAVNEDKSDIIIQCLGVHTVWIDDVIITGDVYRRTQFWSAVTLNKGVHSIYIRLRAKGVQAMGCQIKTQSSAFEVIKPFYLPDIYDGYLFSGWIYLPITNNHATKWLKNLGVSIQSHGSQQKLSVNQAPEYNLAIAPGQTRALAFEIISDSEKIMESCSPFDMKLKISSSEGPVTYPLTLRCRKAGESFLFTFLDHDGSVQHAAAIAPIKSCEEGICPTLLTLHGTTVPAQNQADSYKHMVNSEFIFGLDKAWVLAPTRFGAHNWEGPGALTAMTALDRLAQIVQQKPWIAMKASSEFVIFAGHSMGGHGAWHLASHFPDRALALVSLAGWVKKEDYGDSNLFFRHDISVAYVEPSVKAVMESCITENEADRFVSNLQGISVITRIGANDRTIHPYFVRRMVRLLENWKVNVTYMELPGKEHWWWDTVKTNDGGCVNDKQLRDFTNYHSSIPASPIKSCDSQHNEDCDSEQPAEKYTKSSSGSNQEGFTYTVINPAFGECMRGLQIISQIVPYHTSKIQVEFAEDFSVLKTTNVKCFTTQNSVLRSSNWHSRPLKVDTTLFAGDLTHQISGTKRVYFCYHGGVWENCDDCEDVNNGIRSLSSLGPARRIAESPFLIVAGSHGDDDISSAILQHSVYVANLFFLTSDTLAPVILDKDITDEQAENFNLIIIGGPSENSFADRFLQTIPLTYKQDENVFTLQNCVYSDPHTGVLSLARHGTDRLAMVLMGLSLTGLQDVISLATPTIPPMTRSPFSNLIPDFVITGSTYRARGPGGYECAGFWGNHWELRPHLISCSHCL